MLIAWKIIIIKMLLENNNKMFNSTIFTIKNKFIAIKSVL
jgi:hypothetical protein